MSTEEILGLVFVMGILGVAFSLYYRNTKEWAIPLMMASGVMVALPTIYFTVYFVFKYMWGLLIIVLGGGYFLYEFLKDQAEGPIPPNHVPYQLIREMEALNANNNRGNDQNLELGHSEWRSDRSEYPGSESWSSSEQNECGNSQEVSHEDDRQQSDTASVFENDNGGSRSFHQTRKSRPPKQAGSFTVGMSSLLGRAGFGTRPIRPNDDWKDGTSKLHNQNSTEVPKPNGEGRKGQKRINNGIKRLREKGNSVSQGSFKKSDNTENLPNGFRRFSYQKPGSY